MAENWKFANHAVSAVESWPDIVDPEATKLRVTSGTGASFPLPAATEQFVVVLENRADGLFEICYCTERSGDTLTVRRAREGTIQYTWPAGTTVALRMTAAVYADIQDSVRGITEDYVSKTADEGTFEGSITVDQDFSVGQKLEVTGTSTMTGASSFTGKATFSGNVDIDDGTVEWLDSEGSSVGQVLNNGNAYFQRVQSQNGNVASQASSSSDDAYVKFKDESGNDDAYFRWRNSVTDVEDRVVQLLYQTQNVSERIVARFDDTDTNEPQFDQSVITRITGDTRYVTQDDSWATAGTPTAALRRFTSDGVNGGSVTAGSWQVYPLSGTIRNNGSYINYNGATNSFTPIADGWVDWTATFYRCAEVSTRLAEGTGTNANTGILGMTGYARDSSEAAAVTVAGAGRIYKNQEYTLQYYSQNSQATNGLGRSNPASGYTSGNVFALIRIWRLAAD